MARRKNQRARRPKQGNINNMTAIKPARSQGFIGAKAPLKFPEWNPTPPMRKWIKFIVTLTPGTFSTVNTSNLFSSSFGTSAYNVVNIWRVYAYTERITNSNNFDTLSLTPYTPLVAQATQQPFSGEAYDIYKRCSVGYAVSKRDPEIAGPWNTGANFCDVESSNAQVTFFVDCLFY